MPQRLRLLEHWLEETCRLSGFRIEPASSDASFRRYFRVTLEDGTTRVAMDAPPDREDCRPFVAVAGLMAGAGLHVPQIHALDLEQGFLLLEDLGNRPYLPALNEASVGRLYGDAMNALVRLQRDASPFGLPAYDRALLEREMALLPEWLLARHLGLDLGGDGLATLRRSFDALVENALAQPVVCVHRDFHSRNLMIVEGANPGVIDFQDAVAGPITYDLVSLLRDCYIRWPQARVDAWVTEYHAAATAAGIAVGADLPTFLEWFDLMGVQRHLKAAGIFARLLHRDGKPGYIADIPRTLGYIVEVGRRRPAVADLARIIEDEVLPRL